MSPKIKTTKKLSMDVTAANLSDRYLFFQWPGKITFDREEFSERHFHGIEIENEIRQNLSPWKSSFFTDFVILYGKDWSVDYAMIIPEPHNIHVTYTMTPKKPDSSQLHRKIKELSDIDCYYLVDGKTNKDEWLLFVLTFENDSKPKDLIGFTHFPRSLIEVIRKAQIEAFKR